jgi:hypothetical protein
MMDALKGIDPGPVTVQQADALLSELRRTLLAGHDRAAGEPVHAGQAGHHLLLRDHLHLLG